MTLPCKKDAKGFCLLCCIDSCPFESEDKELMRDIVNFEIKTKINFLTSMQMSTNADLEVFEEQLREKIKYWEHLKKKYEL